MATRAVTAETLGAWLLKCDPRVNAELLDPAGPGIVSRCVTRGYRASMMQEGDPVVLWVSGGGHIRARGIWGLGRLTGTVHETTDGPAVPLTLRLLDSPVTDTDLRAAGIADLEVQRMPAGANPSWVSRQHWRILGPMLGEGRGGLNDSGTI